MLLSAGDAEGVRLKGDQGVTRAKKGYVSSLETKCLADSKSDAPKGVVGSNPMPSAGFSPRKMMVFSPGNRAFFMRRPETADCRNIRACPTMSGRQGDQGVTKG